MGNRRSDLWGMRGDRRLMLGNRRSGLWVMRVRSQFDIDI
ncbi:hypothetical protein APA_305 [Pseudanabaena sp. lw0831]|nr:hypothetical protein APA_1555 [Pseudanabaena sp. lw0831]GBO52636.1 hypothetical protein APA_305 [Pseudanabaena sp. lw0831]